VNVSSWVDSQKLDTLPGPGMHRHHDRESQRFKSRENASQVLFVVGIVRTVDRAQVVTVPELFSLWDGVWW
jgi:hypothetical protein